MLAATRTKLVARRVNRSIRRRRRSYFNILLRLRFGSHSADGGRGSGQDVPAGTGTHSSRLKAITALRRQDNLPVALDSRRNGL